MIKRFLPAFLAFVFIVTSVPALAQLEGHDSAPGDSCAGLSAGATRMNASAAQDGSQIMLICDGSVWQSAGTVGGGGNLTGMIAAFESDTCPAGWTEYTAARGRFLRGIDNGAGNDPDGTRTAGNVQGDELGSHRHSVDPPSTATSSGGNHRHSVDPPNTNTNTAGNHSHDLNGATPLVSGGSPSTNRGGSNPVKYATSTKSAGAHHHSINIPAFNSAYAGNHTHSVNIAAFNSAYEGGAETRPKNVAVIFCEYTGSGGGGGGSPATLASLTDVNVSGATEGQSLVFVGGTWTAQDGVADNLGDHTATKDLNLSGNNLVNGGSVQIANDSDACTSAKDGAIRYVTSNDPPWEFCDGGTTTWAPFKQPRCEDDDTGECYLDADRSDDDPDFTAANIADGVNILGVTGTYTGGGCTAPASCTSVGDVCSDGSLFAGFMLYNGSCEPLYVTDNNQSTSSQWKFRPPFPPPVLENDIPGPVDKYDAVDGQYNRDNRGSGSYPAFELCENNTYHGKSDWYLPARAELNLLWLNASAINANAAGDFFGDYWSSTEVANNASLQYFSGFSNSGEQIENDKEGYYAVRCVRRD